MNTDPLLQRTYDDGFDSATEEINMLMEQLTEAWGSLAIACDGKTCAVGDGVDLVYAAPTLLDALRMAAAQEAI